MNRLDSKSHRQVRRKMRVRRKVTGTPERYRLSVFRSVNHIYAQIIDDTTSKTLVSASTVDKEIRAQISKDMDKSAESKLVGVLLAKRAKANNIARVAFDRNGYLYHGRVKSLAEGAREGGLDF
ncbi:MAG: 50S ribosomal protein L18 [Bacteroidetes bacterium]|jgi:large subunit ribosomal protein L18|nr:50S ribosomal protein L18 [Bacteroidota bacterium]